MTKPRLFLHIGMAKTGTTAIQSFCWENRRLLAEAGVLYPDRGVVAGAHHQLSPMIPPDLADAWPYEPIESWAPALAAVADRPVLLSSELISNAAPKLVRRIAAVLEPHFDTRVVIYVRRIDTAVMASYNQQVKAGYQRNNIERTVNNIFWQLRLDRVLRSWIEAFGIGRLILRPYEREQLVGGDVVTDLCHALGIDWQDGFVRAASGANPRLAPEALEYKRLLNNVVRGPANSGRFVAPLLAWSARQDAGTAQAFQGTDLLPDITRLRMIEQLAPFYRKLARGALGRKDGKLFFAPMPDPGRSWSPVLLTNARIAEITAEIATPELSALLSEQCEDARRSGDLVRMTCAARFAGT